MGDDGLADVGLPDADDGDAVARHWRGRIDQAIGDGERTDRGGQVAAVARPVDEVGLSID
jgi:ribosomal protein L18